MKTTGCVLDWRGGTHDWSRYHHSITNNNAIPVRGVNGEGMEFNGVDACIGCGNHASLNITDAITIEGWVNIASRVGYAPIVAKLTDTMGYVLDLTSDGQYIRANFRDESGWNPIEDDTTLLELSVWYYITWSYDKQNQRLYINGNEVKSIANTTAIVSSDDILRIGRDATTEPIYFNGAISIARIYNRALTPLEIWNNYQLMKPYVPLSRSPVAIV